MHSMLEQLYAHEGLTFAQSHQLFNLVMQGELDNTSLSALLVALKMKGESSQEIAGAASAMRENALAFDRPDYAFSDLVGTGGDGHNTINISSAAAVVAASCGIKVAKHGNRSVSSKSGSSDLFAGFGMKLDMSPKTARQCLDDANLCFLAAPTYHLGMKYVMPIRTTLKTRTIFNVLGPLANPANPTHGIYGVYTPELLDVYADTLLQMGHQNALVVHGSGLDEIALHGPSQARYVHGGKITSIDFSPADFGLAESPLSAIEGGEPSFNVAAIQKVFAGKGDSAHVNAIAMNAAALLWLHQPDKSFAAHTSIILDAIAKAMPLDTISKAATLSQGVS
ncbi:anthranilate phosphoribosyltransferase [Glaciecola petra]|uniref:Anthranilate phosphoribosyltransferase n=1 Tax=Glaciecola petra TaxID=3075602 RepID=A0ABU2ZPQ4_9ALTE|nr:anthranilate phosphoribosyltransferase [Aestuariibacter sp. P117]MDT0594597.1 anthranilate phosphoribosyltransferase [Aestuariibacter sp. P117]